MTEETNLPKKITATNKPGSIKSQFKIRNHSLFCDEEPLYGGHDEAPDPYDYVMTGVGGCTIVSLRQFADRKDWNIGDINLIMTYDSVNGEDVVTKEVTFSNPISEQQKKILLRIAHCGTEQMIEKGMKFTNRIVD